jgi:hypothetical protein
MAMTCMSLAKGLSISRSRAAISRSSASGSMRSVPTRAFIRRPRARMSVSTMKSAPFSMKACTGGGRPLPRRDRMPVIDLLVRSGFCSEPDSANSFLMMARESTNHE